MAALIVLSACTVGEAIQSLWSEDAKIAQLCKDISDRNAGVTCTNRMNQALADIANQADAMEKAGDITPATSDALAKNIERLGKDIDTAQDLILAGDFTTAQGKVATLRTAISGLRRSLNQ